MMSTTNWRSARLVPVMVTTLVAAGAVAGCGSNSFTTNGAKSRQITLVQGVKGDEFYITMACGARDEARRNHVSLSVTGPGEFTPEAQTPVVTSVTARHPDAVLIAPTDSEAMIPPLRQMKQAGITVVEVDTTVKDRSVAAASVATDNTKGGQLAANTLSRLVGDRGSVLVINVAPGISTTDDRAKGFAQAMAERPGITTLGTQYSNDDPAKAASIVTATLSAHPDLSGIFATNVKTAEGVATGLRNAGAQDRVKIVGFDASPKNVEDLRNGLLQAVIAQQPEEIGRQGVAQALAALSGKSTTRRVETGLVALTRDDLRDPDKQSFLYRESC